MPERTAVEAAWDREYEYGRYRLSAPLAFVDDIITAAGNAGLMGSSALYIGCGNGRNFVPLVDAGLDLVGLDVSTIAISQLRARLPDRADRLIHGDLSSLPPDTRFGCVVAIQVFQHGDGPTARAHIERAKELVQPGGIIAIRVNATQTELEYRHDLVETEPASGYTVRYREGPKEGLLVHFFDPEELASLFVERFEVNLPLRLDTAERTAPSTGSWSQWEGIWRRRAPSSSPPDIASATPADRSAPDSNRPAPP
ncbi:MAG: class I SAM-dependent methyltransferase [Actinomycetota bacterium]